MVSRQGIDFTDLRNVLLGAAALFVMASFLSWIQGWILAGVVQRTMHHLRAEVEDKINRLPLSYIDKTPRGDLLSRVSNDIDNLAMTMQQSLSQFLTSLLTILAVTVMMFIISPVLALFAIVLIPVSMGLVRLVSKRSLKRFMNQWKYTGALNAQVEETFTGHALVKVFGRQ